MCLLALGALFLYWGIRGLRAALIGIRAGSSTPTVFANALALVIAGLSFWAGYHLVTDPALARSYAVFRIRKNLAIGALLLGFGVLSLVNGEAVYGAGILLLGLAYLAISWRFRNDYPLDSQLLEAVHQAMRVDNEHPAAAAGALQRAFEAADQRAEHHLAELRNRARTIRERLSSYETGRGRSSRLMRTPAAGRNGAWRTRPLLRS